MNPHFGRTDFTNDSCDSQSQPNVFHLVLNFFGAVTIHEMGKVYEKPHFRMENFELLKECVKKQSHYTSKRIKKSYAKMPRSAFWP